MWSRLNYCDLFSAGPSPCINFDSYFNWRAKCASHLSSQATTLPLNRGANEILIYWSVTTTRVQCFCVPIAEQYPSSAQPASMRLLSVGVVGQHEPVMLVKIIGDFFLREHNLTKSPIEKSTKMWLLYLQGCSYQNNPKPERLAT